MLIVSCSPPPGFDVYRCGWRLEERDGRLVRIGLCWAAGDTVLPDDALTAEQLHALQNDPGKRIRVRHVQEQAPDETALDVNADGAAPCSALTKDLSTLPPMPSGTSAPERAAQSLPQSRPRRALVTRINRRDIVHRKGSASASPHRRKPQLCTTHRSGSGPPPKRAALAAPLP